MTPWSAILLLWVFLAGGMAFAATPEETIHLEAARRAFTDRNFEHAEKSFGEFVKLYGASENVPEALLGQARASFELRQFDRVLELLPPNLGRAGKKADEFLYWSARARMQKADHRAAAATFRRLVTEFPASEFKLDAGYGEALAWFDAGDRRRAVELLASPTNMFQVAAKARPEAEAAVRGHLLHAEALRLLEETPAALAALQPLSGRNLKPETLWRREQLMAQLQLASRQTNAALTALTNAIAAAGQARATELAAASHDLAGKVWEGLGNPEAAVRAFTNNLTPTAPGPLRQTALDRIANLNLARNQPEEAARIYEGFVAVNPQDSLLDQARLRLGELRLRQFYDLPAEQRAAAVTNFLARAVSQFDQVVTNFPNSPLRPRAHFQLGWCGWEAAQLTGDTGRLARAQADFALAAERLPVSRDQAIARYKTADCLFLQKDFAGAITNYQAVIDRYADLPPVKASLFEQALYQIVRASTEINDFTRATGALEKILAWYPGSSFGDRGLLVAGQSLNRGGNPRQARELFERYVNKLPASPLLPEIRQAIARTHIEEGNWDAAAAEYDRLAALANGTNTQASIEFDRALAHSKGNPSNAFQLFTNYLVRFPADTNVPVARLWLADYWFNQGLYVQAEQNYRELAESTNWPPELTLLARMNAGRAAVARTGYKEAIEDFLKLISDKRCPTNLYLEALFAHGDTRIEAPADPLKPLEPLEQRYAEAINSFDLITRSGATNRLVALAYGKIGNCHLQLASLDPKDPKRYESAAQAYTNAMIRADISARSQAEVGLGVVREKQGLNAADPGEKKRLASLAMEHFSRVLYRGNLVAGEAPDPVWVGEAGLQLLRMAEGRLDWPLVMTTCNRLLVEQPGLREQLQAKLEKAQGQLPGALPK